MGVALDHLARDPLRDAADVEPPSLLGEAREEKDLEQKIPELSFERFGTVLVHRRERFVGLLQEERLEGLEGLLAVPGALPPQTVDEGDEAIEALGHARIIPGALPG